MRSFIWQLIMCQGGDGEKRQPERLMEARMKIVELWQGIWSGGPEAVLRPQVLCVSPPSPLHHHHFPLPVRCDVWRLWSRNRDAPGRTLDGSEWETLALPEDRQWGECPLTVLPPFIFRVWKPVCGFHHRNNTFLWKIRERRKVKQSQN